MFRSNMLSLLVQLCSFAASTEPGFGRRTGSNIVNLETLQFVQVIFRHGDRNQIFTCPSCSEVSEEDNGRLTDVGKLQTFNLGTFMRRRYKDFVSDFYQPEELLVISSDLERTVISAEMVLAGLYKPRNTSSNKNVTIDKLTGTIPIHRIPKAEDNLIKMTKSCPAYEMLLNELRNSEWVTNWTLEYQGLIDYINYHAGTNETTLFGIAFIGDILAVERAHGHRLADWQAKVYEKMQEIYDTTMKLETSNPPLKRLKCGPLLKLLLRNFQNAPAQKRKGNARFVLYSGHDDIIVSLRNSLSISDSTHPPYAAALIFELHKNPEYNQSYVEIYYRNLTRREPYQLILEACKIPCYLSRLVQITENVVPENWDAECTNKGGLNLGTVYSELESMSHSDGGYFYLMMGVLVVTTVITLLAVVHKIKGLANDASVYDSL